MKGRGKGNVSEEGGAKVEGEGGKGIGGEGRKRKGKEGRGRGKKGKGLRKGRGTNGRTKVNKRLVWRQSGRADAWGTNF